MPVRPWWIVSFLDASRAASIEGVLRSLLMPWSRENGLPTEPDAAWWVINHLSGQPETSDPEVEYDTLSSFLYNPFREKRAATKLGGDVDPSILNILAIADTHCLGLLLSFSMLLRHRRDQLFPGVNLSITLLLCLPQAKGAPDRKDSDSALFLHLSQMHTLMTQKSVADRPFDKVLVIQDANWFNGNRDGYNVLSESQMCDLLCQVCFHLLVGDNDCLRGMVDRCGTCYIGVGAFGIYYEPYRLIEDLASEIGKDLIEKFARATERPFVDDDQVTGALAQIKGELDPLRLFELLIGGRKRQTFVFEPAIWESAKDSRGKSVSPWAIFSPALLKVYFLLHLKRLPARLSEYAKLFLTGSFKEFRDLVRSKRKDLVEGTEPGQGLKGKVNRIVKSVFDGQYGDARSVEQARLVFQAIQKLCEPGAAERMLREAELYRGLNVFEVPDYLREFYDNAADRLEADEENRLYEAIVNAVGHHPVPLALFLRAFLTGIAFGFAVVYLLQALSPRILNVEWLTYSPTVTFLLAALVPPLVAFWRYKVRTLNEIRKRTRRYVAAVLRHAQTEARETALNEIIELLREIADHCVRIRGEDGREDVPGYLIEMRERLSYLPRSDAEGFKSTAFFQPITESIAVPGRGSFSVAPHKSPCRIKIGQEGGYKTYDTYFPTQNKNQIIGRILGGEAVDSNGRRERDLLEELCGGLPDGFSDERAANCAILFRRHLMEQIEQPAQRLHDFWIGAAGANETERQAMMKAAVSGIKALAWPASEVSETARQMFEVVFERKYGSPDFLERFFPGLECSSAPGTSAIFFAGFKPIPGLSDLGPLRIVLQAGASPACSYDDLATVLMALLLSIDPFQIRGFADDQQITFANDPGKYDALKSKLSQALGIAGEAARPLHPL